MCSYRWDVLFVTKENVSKAQIIVNFVNDLKKSYSSYPILKIFVSILVNVIASLLGFGR